MVTVVNENGSQWMEFIVAKVRRTGEGRWEYQIKPKDSPSGLYNGGQWVSESKLRPT